MNQGTSRASEPHLPAAPASPILPLSHSPTQRALAALLLAALLLPNRPAGAVEQSDPGRGWRFAFQEFVIAAWSPPGATEAEYALYKDAGFNLVMSPRYAFPQQSLDLAAKHGLKVMVDTYAPNDHPWGGKADAYTAHPSHHPATLSELRWLHERVGKHPALAGYLLGDDIGVVPQELVETTEFLRRDAPHLFPWICQCTHAWESLARIGNPLADPQIYPTLYQKHLPATYQRDEYCKALDRLRQTCRRLHLVSWPMFNVCGDSPAGSCTVSDPFLRFQPYAALAYGAQGIWYFTYACLPGKEDGKPHSTPSLAVVKEVNRRVGAWGPRLLGCDAVGVFHTDFAGGTGLAPGQKQLIRRMSPDLLVGLLLGRDGSVYAMAVDKRVGGAPAEWAPRKVSIEFAPDVQAISPVSADGPPRWERGRKVSLSLPAGGGELLALRGPRLAEAARRAAEQSARFGVRRRTGKVGPEGILLHLGFDEGQGNTARDRSGAKNDALLSGGAAWAPGKSGGGLDDRAAGDAAGIADAFLPTKEEITVACWVNPVYPKQGYGPVLLIGSGGVDRLEFGFGPDNLYPVLSDQESHSGSRLYLEGMRQLLPEGTWGHIAVAAGPKGATLYVNGIPQRRTDYAGRFDFQGKSIALGRRVHEEYTGLVDEVRIYNRCLSDEEVKRLFLGTP